MLKCTVCIQDVIKAHHENLKGTLFTLLTHFGVEFPNCPPATHPATRLRHSICFEFEKASHILRALSPMTQNPTNLSIFPFTPTPLSLCTWCMNNFTVGCFETSSAKCQPPTPQLQEAPPKADCPLACRRKRERARWSVSSESHSSSRGSGLFWKYGWALVKKRTHPLHRE